MIFTWDLARISEAMKTEDVMTKINTSTVRKGESQEVCEDFPLWYNLWENLPMENLFIVLFIPESSLMQRDFLFGTCYGPESVSIPS